MRSKHGNIDKFVEASKRPRSIGLKPVEKKQVKRIARKLDDAGKQLNELIHVTPVDSGTGASYSNYIYPGIPSQTASLMNLFPPITQGVKRNQRDGSRIKLTGVRCKFFFQIPTDADSDRPSSLIACRLLVCSCKTLKQFSQINANWDAAPGLLNRKYLRDGEQETAFQGDMKSLHFPVNTALFTTHYDKKFTLHRGEIRGEPGPGLTNVPAAYKQLKLNLKVKSVNVRWPDDGATESMNFAPMAILMYAPMDGGHTLGTGGIVHGNCVVHTTWKDMD